MKKQIPALIATILVISFLAIAMGATSVSALTNINGTPNSNNSSGTSLVSNQTQTDQFQARIVEYQQRELQYQQLLANDQSQIKQAADQVSQIQKLLFALQQQGLISIHNDGTISINSQASN